MCAAFEFKGRNVKPGREVIGSGKSGIVRHVWAGFARQEILSWWQKRGAVLIDVPATRFAERSNITGKLLWENLAQGHVIRGIVDSQTRHRLIKIVTRASTPDELAHFQHPRMPQIEKPLFGPVPEGIFEDVDADLFD